MLVPEEAFAMISLETPLGPEDVGKLKVGDAVKLSGTIFTGRDRAHLFFLPFPGLTFF